MEACIKAEATDDDVVVASLIAFFFPPLTSRVTFFLSFLLLLLSQYLMPTSMHLRCCPPFGDETFNGYSPSRNSALHPVRSLPTSTRLLPLEKQTTGM